MKPQETFEEFAVQVNAELRRAYAGHMAPEEVAAAVNQAIAYAWDHRRRMARVANPIGHLYRIGLIMSNVTARDWSTWSEDAAIAGVHPALSAELGALPKAQARAVWLVRACGWTNVQAGEALEISPATLSSRVVEGMERLGAALGEAVPDSDAQLEALANHRLASVPDEVIAEVTEPDPRLKRRASWLSAPAVQRLVALAAALALVGGIVLVVRPFDASDFDSVGLESVSLSMNERQVIARSDWAQPLSDSGQVSTFVLARTGEGFDTIQAAVPERATQPFVPASTFKILNALIILQTGTLSDVDTNVAWDGVTREFESWNQDHSLRTAMDVSAVWLFQELARQVGDVTMAELVSAAEYGNGDTTGGVDVFWLEGALRTSAIDQIDFLERLALGELPFNPQHQDAVRDILVIDEGPGWEIRYKTGTTLKTEPALAWLVGIVDTEDGQWVFAYNVDLPPGGSDVSRRATRDRLDLVIELLESAEVIRR